MKENTKSDLGFIHKFIPAADRQDQTTLLLLHGTGGNEQDLISLARELNPRAAILSPRGKVLESGMPRFFRRLAEGIFDIEDLKFRTHELAQFVEKASKVYEFDLRYVISVGYSNGANIASSLLLLRPEIISSVVLFRAMVPFIPEKVPDLKTKHIFMAAGKHDPIVPKEQTETLYRLYKKAGANVVLHWEENSGHELGYDEVPAAKGWLANILRE
ncbi:MAG TPA: alpha/beta hydrolase [Nitrososphaeraceae archaeon]|jgi:phospholipase/carboxylesterase|nr:alpha/beta hydrolase [Nitrososphaeraceae archaeon]